MPVPNLTLCPVKAHASTKQLCGTRPSIISTFRRNLQVLAFDVSAGTQKLVSQKDKLEYSNDDSRAFDGEDQRLTKFGNIRLAVDNGAA